MNRSVALKLTLAFVAVGLMGAILVALFVGARTQALFDRFVLDRFQLDTVEQLAIYYEQNDSWGDLANTTRRPGQRRLHGMLMRAPITVVDTAGIIIFSNAGYPLGITLPNNERDRVVTIIVNGDEVGGVLFSNPPQFATLPASPESVFLRQVRQAILFGSLGAAFVALILGILLARTISQPVRELTEATKQIAQGRLGYQVEVHSQDELGELALSFNQMSDDLAEASRLRRQMVADIAHDLRTPLSVIHGYAEALADGKLQGNTHIYDVLHDETSHLQHLVDDLRTLSLADAGELPLQLVPTSPTSLLTRAMAAQQAAAGTKAITLTLETAETLPAIIVDPERMAQVLGNLITNAIRHTPEGGDITLAAQVQGNAVQLQVRDTGVGISPETLPHIFDRFYRGDAARAQEDGASGLGLAIAKSLVEAQQGHISVESIPHVRTIFTIQFPVARKTA